MAVAVEALSPAASPPPASVPVEWFIEWIETEPLMWAEDHPSVVPRPARRRAPVGR